MSQLEVSTQDVASYVKMKVYTELTLVKEKLRLFEKKYHCDFPQFESQVVGDEEENFERWDDYMEWKAFHTKYDRLKKKIA